MPRLILKSLEIQHFRAFRHFQVEQLGRVNLIVGKNNVGKSSLLEALRVYAHRGSPTVLWDILVGRNESALRNNRVEPIPEDEDPVLDLRYLFFRRQDIRNASSPIRIGPIEASNDALMLAVEWQSLTSVLSEGKQATMFDPDESVEPLLPVLVVQVGSESPLRYRLDQEVRNISRRLSQTRGIPELRATYVPANGLSNQELARLWDRITLTNAEQDVLNALQIIAPEVERLSVVGDQASSRTRIPVVRMADYDYPVPLRSMGEGLNRMLGIALSLANARDGLFLIDEIESGLHYSVQADMWRIVFQMARRLNVQVFATSHSWDCIEAFQQAAQEDTNEQGILVRLERKQDDIVPTHFDERELDIATREQIEVR